MHERVLCPDYDRVILVRANPGVQESIVSTTEMIGTSSSGPGPSRGLEYVGLVPELRRTVSKPCPDRIESCSPCGPFLAGRSVGPRRFLVGGIPNSPVVVPSPDKADRLPPEKGEGRRYM